MLRVYGRANSINVRKVLWILEELGVSYEREDWGRGFRPTTEEPYASINPFGVIPAIDDDGFILRESHSIVRYLVSKHERSDLYPNDLKQRAIVEAWMDWGGGDGYDHARPVTHAKVFNNPDYQDPRIQERAIAGWNRQMSLLDSALAATGPHLLGEQFTIADIPAGLLVNRWYSIDFEKPVLAHLQRYYDKLAERGPYQLHGRNGTP